MSEPPKTIYDTDEYYGSDRKATRIPYAHSLFMFFDWLKARNAVCKTGITKGRALDIGGGDGKYLYFMQKRGFRVQGTTASRNAAVAAKELYNVPLLYTTEIPSEIRQQRFDIMSYWHVFEHLENENEHADVWNQIINPGGYLIIEVPNVSSLGAKLCYRSWLGSDDKHHINHRPPEYIRELLMSRGFAIERVEWFSAKFSYLFLWSALLGWCFGKRYDFDSVFGVLKSPFRNLQSNFFQTLNAILAIAYFAPFIVVLLLLESVLQRGEIVRFYAKNVSEKGLKS